MIHTHTQNDVVLYRVLKDIIQNIIYIHTKWRCFGDKDQNYIVFIWVLKDTIYPTKKKKNQKHLK
jgi:hypothetical protein